MRSISFVALVAFALCGTAAQAQDANHLTAHLQPRQEVPAVQSPSDAQFTATIDLNVGEISYEMTFSGLQADITQSHIHFGQPNVNGGIMVWLCGTASNPGPAGTQTCPQSGTITGVLHQDDVQMLTSQGVPAGGFGELVFALQHGLAYANIHSTQSPGGELRGLIRVVRQDE